MDPLADKILVASALLALVELQVLPSWVALVILVREFIVSGLRMVPLQRVLLLPLVGMVKPKQFFRLSLLSCLSLSSLNSCFLFMVKWEQFSILFHGPSWQLL